MAYNYARELKKWQLWKQEEEQLLTKFGVAEDIIIQLRDYDYQMFLSERRIRRRQTATKDSFFLNIPYYDYRDIITIDDLLDNIDDQSLLAYLSKVDSKTLMILLMKILGYTITEISEILDMNEAAIYSRIHRLKKKLKKFNK